MTAFAMEPAHNTPDSHEGDQRYEGRQPQQQHPLAASTAHGETWSFDSLPGAEGSSTTASTPHVSLFSPSVPPILPPKSPEPAPSNSSGSSRAHVNLFASPNHSRSMPSLGAVANMKRTARLKLSDAHPPIVQLHTQIPEAQKSGDDPTTPLESPSRKRTTMDLMRHERTTMTSLSKLFSETAMMPGSRAPSYNNATGPLYLRGISIFYLLHFKDD